MNIFCDIKFYKTLDIHNVKFTLLDNGPCLARPARNDLSLKKIRYCPFMVSFE